MKSIPIKRAIEKIPGGMIITPLLIGSLLNTFCPGILLIGGFTTGIAKGTPALVGVMFLCMGARLDPRCAKQAVKTGSTLIFVKFALSAVLGLFVAHFFNNNLLGLSCLAIIGGISTTNGALYASLVEQYGTESDRGAAAIVIMNGSPFMTMIIMGAAGTAAVPFKGILASLLPLIVGFVLGNLDPDLRKILTNAVDTINMLCAFAIGCSISLDQVVIGGISGIVLGVMSLLLGSIVCIAADKLSGGSGIAGAAMSSIAANSIATPTAMAEIEPALASSAGVAAAQLASSVILTCLFTPFLVAAVARWNQRCSKF